MEALQSSYAQATDQQNLGFAYIIPYKDKGNAVPQFQVGYKGYIQLSLRTGQYKYINADLVYDGEFVKYDKLTGELDLSGKAKKRHGCRVLCLHRGPSTGLRNRCTGPRNRSQPAKRYSKSYNYASSPWKNKL